MPCTNSLSSPATTRTQSSTCGISPRRVSSGSASVWGKPMGSWSLLVNQCANSGRAGAPNGTATYHVVRGWQDQSFREPRVFAVVVEEPAEVRVVDSWKHAMRVARPCGVNQRVDFDAHRDCVAADRDVTKPGRRGGVEDERWQRVPRVVTQIRRCRVI